MKILFLPKYDTDGASSRYRTFQYLPLFSNISYVVSPFFKNGYIGKLGRSQNFLLLYIQAFLYRCFVVLCLGRKFDLIVIEKELIPFFPPVLEFLILVMRNKYVLDFDDAIYCNYQYHCSKYVRFCLGHKIDKISSWASGITTGSPELTSYFKVLNKNVVEIPTSIDFLKYETVATTGNVNNFFVVGWIGSHSTSKHLDVVSEVLIDFLLQHSDVRLHLIGYYGNAFDNVKNVFIIPWAGETELLEIAKFSLGIMPLIEAPFEHGKCGFKLIQYMACGKPTVSTPFITNIKIDGSNGNLFASTSKEWLSCLEQIYSNRCLFHEVGLKNRVTVREKYCIQVNYWRYLDFYNSIMNIK